MCIIFKDKYSAVYASIFHDGWVVTISLSHGENGINFVSRKLSIIMEYYANNEKNFSILANYP